MFPVPPIFQQQFFAGCQAAQQGFFLESQGNLLLAINCYQQAINCVSQSMFSARQASVPVPDHVYHAHGQMHFFAARAKATVGDVVGAQQHLMEAMNAFSFAANLNPMVPHHRVALGDVLMLLGNLPEAERTFNSALQILPGHPYVLQRLAAIRYVSMGQAGMPAYPTNSGGSSKDPGMEKIQDLMKVAGQGVDLLSKFQKLIGGTPTHGAAAMGDTTMQDFNSWAGMMMGADPNFGGGWGGPDFSGF
jgi:tetratricopeptide (TPR) repeat protein